MAIKLTTNSTGKGPNLLHLFYKPEVQFHLEKTKKEIKLMRILNGRVTHSLSSHVNTPEYIDIQPVNNSTSYVWKLDMNRIQFIDFISSMENVHTDELPKFFTSMSKIELKGVPMSKESILNLIA